MPEIFVARQPIFDRALHVYGYEILFRHSSLENFFAHPDPDEAALRVIHDSLHVFGLDVLAQDRRIFFNVTRQVLVENLVRMLPRERTVVELLETVEPDEEVIEACRALKEAGYLLALDDFVIFPGCEPLLELADIVKVDFLASEQEARREVPTRFAREGLRFLAEKVETGAQFREALELGYDLFQGYFFRRPEILAAREVPSAESGALRLLALALQAPLDLQAADEVLKHDLRLAARILRVLNAPPFGWKKQITSLSQAHGLLGDRDLRRWTALGAVMELGASQPEELLITSLLRARLCEELALRAEWVEQAPDLFVAGLLSGLDAMLGRQQHEILRDLQVPEELRGMLAGTAGRPAAIFRLAFAYETGRFDEATTIAYGLGLDANDLPALYRAAVAWAERLRQI